MNKRIISKLYAQIGTKNKNIVIPSHDINESVSELESYIFVALLSVVGLEFVVSMLLEGNLLKLTESYGSAIYEDIERRNLPEYREWRKAVYARDGYRCQECDKVGGRIEAHHIKSWKNFRELRYDVDNGITLCHECHKETNTFCRRLDKKEELWLLKTLDNIT